MTKFSQRLRELRNSRHMTQQELADRIGMSKSSINMYERGQREPGLETLEAFADTFNVDMDYLLGKSQFPRNNFDPAANSPAPSHMSENGFKEEFSSPPQAAETCETDELNAYLEELRTRPEMKMLFSLTKSATKEDVKKAVKVIEALFEK